MKTTSYLTLEEALELHSNLIERFGGTGGIRDLGLLESALIRPRTGYYKSLSLQAAALFQSLIQNHAFIDGNKRMAFAASAIFLRMNGFKIIINATKAENFIIEDIIKNKADIQKISTWLEEHMIEI